jgi:hypothetical protein
MFVITSGYCTGIHANSFQVGLGEYVQEVQSSFALSGGDIPRPSMRAGVTKVNSTSSLYEQAAPSCLT